MKNFKHTEKFKVLYIEHPCIHRLDSIIDILLKLLYHAPIHLAIISLSYFFLMHFKVVGMGHLVPKHLIN